MMNFPRTSVKVSRGFVYSYIHILPTILPKQYILFLHGFPSLPIDFHNQISHLSSLGYGIIAPELLGYGDTSHPAESDLYRVKLIAKDLVDILDYHSISAVFGVGHDIGVGHLTRLEFYHPTRVTRMALVAIGPTSFGQRFDLDAVNAMMKEQLGYEGFGYIDFFTRDPEAPSILNSHQESFRDLVFQADGTTWKNCFGPVGALKKWLVNDRRVQPMTGYSDKVRQEHEIAFSDGKGGYTGTLHWYKNHVSNANIPDEEDELRRRRLDAYQTSKPVLQFLATNDPISLASIHEQMTRAYAPHAQLKKLNTHHWVMLEEAGAVSQELERFFGTTASDDDHMA